MRRGLGLDGPNSVAVSADGENVYATSLKSSSIAIFQRNPSTGALTQTTDGFGCLAAAAIPGCQTARGLVGADVVAVSPDGRDVYTGSFVGNTVAAFARYNGGALQQLFGTGGCISQGGTGGCASAIAMTNVEGLAVSGDGDNVYAAAPGSNAVDVLARDPSTGRADAADRRRRLLHQHPDHRLHHRAGSWAEPTRSRSARMTRACTSRRCSRTASPTSAAPPRPDNSLRPAGRRDARSTCSRSPARSGER